MMVAEAHSSADRQATARSVAIVTLSFIVMFAGTGFFLVGLTNFDTAMIAEFHLSHAALKFRDTVMITATMLSVPIVGVLLDRVPARVLIIFGLALMAVGLSAYRYVDSINEIYAVHVLLGVSQASSGLVAQVFVVSRWTTRHRGFAIGLVIAGQSLGNAVIPMFNGALLHFMPWRDVVSVGGLIAAILIPLVFFVYRERPADDRPAAEKAADTAADHEISSAGGKPGLGLIFWLLAVTAGATALGLIGLVTNLALYIQTDLNLPSDTAQAVLLMLYLGSCGAQLVAGYAADRYSPARIHTLSVALMAVGAIGMLSGRYIPGLGLAAAAMGIGWGVNATMIQLQGANLFSPTILGRTLGLLAVAECAGAALGPTLVGLGRDFTGTYRISIISVFVLTCLALACVMRIASRRLVEAGRTSIAEAS